MKILVTGASGFIGRYILREISATADEAIASAHSTVPQLAINGRIIKTIPFDIAQLDSSIDYYSYFDKPDVVIHLAWEGLPNYKESFHDDVNLPRHKVFLKNLVQNGLKSLTVTGTCLEYGMKEGCLSEDMPADPQNSYARAKNELRLFLESLKSSNQFYLNWVRLFYMYGDGQNPNSLLSQLERAIEAGEHKFRMSPGQQMRDYLPVGKVAEYLLKIAKQQGVGIVNCCSGLPVTVESLVRSYIKQKGSQIELELGYYPYNDYEPMNFWGSTIKLNKILDL
jgi:nucleoside-diphosphate-sugar epimerase